MHASNPSDRFVSAQPASAMSHNVPKCPTALPYRPVGLSNDHASDDPLAGHPDLAALSPQQHQALDLLLRGHADSAIAAKLGMDRRTLYRWKHHHPAFIAELNFRQQQLLQQAALLYGRSLRKSFKVVEAVLKKSDSPEATRVALALINGSAGRKVLTQPIGPTDPLSFINALAAEEERLYADVDTGMQRDVADRLARLDQLP